MTQEWHHYVIYFNPLDFPGEYVLRRWRVDPVTTHPIPDLHPVVVSDDIEEARKLVPMGLVRIHRHPSDDIAIVETWL
jgi:hypothetical protein